MALSTTMRPSLVDRLWRAEGASRLARNILLAPTGTALIFGVGAVWLPYILPPARKAVARRR